MISRASLILPGEQGYGAATLAQSVGSLRDVQVADNTSAVTNFKLCGDELCLLAPFAVVEAGSATNTSFAFERANPDGQAHFRILGDNIFGLEDKLGLGDGGYDDLVLGFRTLSLA